MMLLALLACRIDPPPPEEQEPDADIYADTLGDPIPGLDEETLALYDRGREVFDRAFRSDEGLGPSINADSCGSCHQFPVTGGSAPRYRDFWLVKAQRWDGALVDAGTNGVSPVRNLYDGAGHTPEPIDTLIYARRNAPSGLGVGTFSFIADSTILANEDESDADGDGISGRANWEQGRVGRFGYKAQASSLESFNRGAALNQMGITTNPLFYTLPEDPEAAEVESGAWLFDPFGSSVARAQVSAPGEPTQDDDGVPDPELLDEDQLALLVYSVYLAAPRPAEFGPEEDAGEEHFEAVGCTDCHTPRLDSTIGPIRLYSDLLLHEMGEDLADGLGPGVSTGSEWRTAPLFGVALHAPFLHDGRADTLHEAIEWHGGEGEASRDAYLALSAEEQDELVAFLEALGGGDPQGHVLTFSEDDAPSAGEVGGPVEGLSDSEYSDWLAGRFLFDQTATVAEGLGTHFNADSCRACHQDPVLGGAGGIDTNVIRFGSRDLETGTYVPLADPVLPRVAVWGELPLRMPDEANVVEMRNPPSTLGMGAIESISADAILAGRDPDDADEDGISGRARLLDSGLVGRFGWKAQVPTLYDFVADAELNELGVTIDSSTSDFTVADDGDDVADPELDGAAVDSIVTYLRHLAPPPRKPADDAAAAEQGEVLFETFGCASCHTPELDGVPLYSNLLLHDIAPDPMVLVDQEEGLEATEFRTPPLWGVGDTAPYMHDGLAPTLEAAIAGHAGEASAARDAAESATESDREALLAFLATL